MWKENETIAGICGISVVIICFIYFVTSCEKDLHQHKTYRLEYEARIAEANATIVQAEIEQRQLENQSIMEVLKQSLNITNRQAEIVNQPENY